MRPVLLIHEPDLPFVVRRLVQLLSERVADLRTIVLRPSRVISMAATLARRSNPAQVIHAFGSRALAVALLAANAEVLYSPSRFPRRGDVAYVRAALRYRRVQIICSSDAERRAWVTGGVPMERCTLIRPGVSLAISPEARAAARARLGFTDANRIVFTPLPAVGADRSNAVWTGCLLNILDPHTKTLGWAEGGLDSLRVLQSRLIGDNYFTILDDATPEAGFAAADIILLPPGDTTSPTLIAMAMASGRPVVGQVTAQTCELIEDRHTALLTGGRTPKILGERIVDVLSDPELGRKIADRARAEAYEHFLVSRMIADFRTLYTVRPVDDEVATTAPAAAPSLKAVSQIF